MEHKEIKDKDAAGTLAGQDATAHNAVASTGQGCIHGIEGESGEAQASTVQVVSFFLGPDEYAFDVTDAVEVLKPKDITKVPRTPGFIKGILSVRGEMVAVFDLRERLGIPANDAPAHKRSSRILVAGVEEMKSGFIVDRMGGVRDYPIAAFDTQRPCAGGFIKGVIRHGESVINILDITMLTAIKASFASGADIDGQLEGTQAAPLR